MTRTTSTEIFFSKSSTIGSMRWRVEIDDPRVMRCYVFDSAHQGLSSRWNLMWLERDGDMYYLNVIPGGYAPEYVLEPEQVREVLLTQPPVVRVIVTVADDAQAFERFERTASFIMHNLLRPEPSMNHEFTRLATTNG